MDKIYGGFFEISKDRFIENLNVMQRGRLNISSSSFIQYMIARGLSAWECSFNIPS